MTKTFLLGLAATLALAAAPDARAGLSLASNEPPAVSDPAAPVEPPPPDAAPPPPSPAPRRADRPLRPAPAAEPDGYRTARYPGGRGATWRMGANAYGFSGSFGGCRVSGFAGPHGFQLHRSC
ncbi:hypothetical protein [Methylobacterium nodulans]|uniref:Translation initiation factor IF-2 n=1 Tax=Methylobacterium nodulans (strain LMG 21967 / CNCM I-2342 / ORS 2060) TaxID=460265 RepID=B8IPQ9_METNO|nr:hypothetical protein [Methylobacterium nodulans]ACL56559.1 translation initiation factor IF-2 [Methylobacterium nodulans ORS 2060]